MQLPRKSEHYKPGSDEEVPPMTIPWMQNVDFGSVDGPVEDQFKCYLPQNGYTAN